MRPSPPPPRLDHPDDCSQIRVALDAAKFTYANISAALASKDLKVPEASELPILLHRTSGKTPLETLIRLFVLGVPVDEEAARGTLAPMPLERWAAAGFVSVRDGQVVPQVKLAPFKDQVFVFDLPRGTADFVMGVAASSVTLANLTIRRRVEATLDLGTGCGVQACLAAAHSKAVFAVDSNPRAVGFAALNARLNGLGNVDCRSGDRFEPLAGQQFDLIVSNPPFVISPTARYIYRDGGMHGDEFCRQLVRTAPSFLREGGFSQLLCNWVHLGSEDWRERLAGWFEGSGCDVWVLRSETNDPSTYAANWIRTTGERDPDAVSREYDAWTAYYRAQRIEAISFGSITMRRRSTATNWLRIEDAPERMLGPCGEQIGRGFGLRDFVTSATDDILLDTRFYVSPDARLEQQAEPSPEGWRTVASRLKLIRGLAYSGPTDPMSAALLGRCTGKRTLRELLTELSASLETDLSIIAPPCIEVVRRLIERGFLLPFDPEGETTDPFEQ